MHLEVVEQRRHVEHPLASGGLRVRYAELAAGEARYAVWIKPGEEILTGDSRTLRVPDVVPIEDEGSPFVGLLRVQAAR